MSSNRQRGASLIELIVAIVIISVALSSVLLAINRMNRAGTDPMIHAQALAIGEAYLEEILLRRHDNNYCGGAQAAQRSEFQQVWDYDQIDDEPVRDVNGDSIAGLDPYRVTVEVDCTGAIGNPPVAAARITVTVRNDGAGLMLPLYGYRRETD